MYLGSQSFFFLGSLDFCPLFGLPLVPLLKKVLPLWKKEAKRRHETSTFVNQQLLSLLCVVLARRGETLCIIVKGFGERKRAELFLSC